MAICKDTSLLRGIRTAVSDVVVRPGAPVLEEGIYGCVDCSTEVAAVVGQPLRKPEAPSDCTHREWRLVVALRH